MKHASVSRAPQPGSYQITKPNPNAPRPTLEQVLDMIDFEYTPKSKEWRILTVKGTIKGSVWGSIGGSVGGDIHGDVKGLVHGRINTLPWQSIGVRHGTTHHAKG